MREDATTMTTTTPDPNTFHIHHIQFDHLRYTSAAFVLWGSSAYRHVATVVAADLDAVRALHGPGRREPLAGWIADGAPVRYLSTGDVVVDPQSVPWGLTATGWVRLAPKVDREVTRAANILSTALASAWGAANITGGTSVESAREALRAARAHVDVAISAVDRLGVMLGVDREIPTSVDWATLGPRLLQAAKDYRANGCAAPKSCGHAFLCVCPDEALRRVIEAIEGPAAGATGDR